MDYLYILTAFILKYCSSPALSIRFDIILQWRKGPYKGQINLILFAFRLTLLKKHHCFFYAITTSYVDSTKAEGQYLLLNPPELIVGKSLKT